MKILCWVVIIVVAVIILLDWVAPHIVIYLFMRARMRGMVKALKEKFPDEPVSDE